MVSPGRASGSYSRTRTLGWVMAGAAGLLLAVIVGFVALAHRKANHWLAGVPRHLGVNIQQETNSFTLDQSLKGKKIFTLHASKELQHRDGTVTLHDVGIVLYGPTGKPTDKIHGSDFEFDPKAQSMAAKGEVFIDLVPPARDQQGLVGEDESRVVHVKTVGLVFSQKDQVATTDGAVEFRASGYTGNAVGASYDAKAGVVILESAVRMSGVRENKPVLLTASRAQMDRASNRIDLRTPKFVSAGETGSQSITAAHALVYVQPDGTPQHVDADGEVTLAGDSRGTIVADHLQMDLGPTGQARSLHLFTNVRYRDDEEQEHTEGHAEDARLSFDAAGRPMRAITSGNVMFDQKTISASRSLVAGNVELALGGQTKTKLTVQSIKAYGPGGARVVLTDPSAAGMTATDLRADVLTGQLAPRAVGTSSRTPNRSLQLSALDGVGRTSVLRTVNSVGGLLIAKDKSTGDRLHMTFKPGVGGRSELARADQHGAVTTLHEALAPSGPQKGKPATQQARADDLVYEAAANLLQMSGSVAVEEDVSVLYADRVDFHRGTGDANATGSVKATYAPVPNSASSEPLHVIADHATANKASGLAEFFGGVGNRARLWQGGSQIQAPVIDLFKAEKRLSARGERSSDSASVTTVLAPADGPKASSDHDQGPLRIVSSGVAYDDAARTVDFTGSVKLQDRTGTISANSARVWLAGHSAPGDARPVTAGGSAAPVSMTGKVDHLLATGNVQIEQPGRRATGEKLLYTASDGIFLLTGTAFAQPRVTDRAQGSTTGTALRFTSGDNSVEVLGGLPGNRDAKTAGRVRSETRMK